jgi:hypothetical protein
VQVKIIDVIQLVPLETLCLFMLNKKRSFFLDDNDDDDDNNKHCPATVMLAPR